MSDVLVLETALSERDVAALHEWQGEQSRRVAELEVALDFERSEVARLIDLLIETQANENHLRRALEWLATECKLLIEPRVHSVEQIVAGALAATEEALRETCGLSGEGEDGGVNLQRVLDTTLAAFASVWNCLAWTREGRAIIEQIMARDPQAYQIAMAAWERQVRISMQQVTQDDIAGVMDDMIARFGGEGTAPGEGAGTTADTADGAPRPPAPWTVDEVRATWAEIHRQLDAAKEAAPDGHDAAAGA